MANLCISPLLIGRPRDVPVISFNKEFPIQNKILWEKFALQFEKEGRTRDPRIFSRGRNFRMIAVKVREVFSCRSEISVLDSKMIIIIYTVFIRRQFFGRFFDRKLTDAVNAKRLRKYER